MKFSEDDCCGKRMKNKGCCDNKSSVLKVKDDQKAHSYIVFSSTSSIQAALTTDILQPYFNPFRELLSLAYTKAPPKFTGYPPYLVNRSIRI